MSDPAVPIKGQPRVARTEIRRQGKSSALHIMCLESNTVSAQQRGFLPSLETVSAGMELAQKEKYKTEPEDRTDPDFQELKGFMELGFVFSKDKLNPRLLDLLPGLKRLIQNESNSMNTEFEESALENWKLPTPSATGVEMKESLKLWARSVASRLKC